MATENDGKDAHNQASQNMKQILNDLLEPAEPTGLTDSSLPSTRRTTGRESYWLATAESGQPIGSLVAPDTTIDVLFREFRQEPKGASRSLDARIRCGSDGQLTVQCADATADSTPDWEYLHLVSFTLDDLGQMEEAVQIPASRQSPEARQRTSMFSKSTRSNPADLPPSPETTTP